MKSGLTAHTGAPASVGTSPDLIERCAVLAAVKAASRRLRRWPSASLDRSSARRSVTLQAGAEKRRFHRTEKLL